MVTSESHRGPSGPDGLAVKHGIGLGADRIVGHEKRIRNGRAQREEVAHHERPRARVPGEADAAADRRIVLDAVRRRGVQHHEEEGVVRAEIAPVPSALKPPAPAPAGGEIGAGASEEIVW